MKTIKYATKHTIYAGDIETLLVGDQHLPYLVGAHSQGYMRIIGVKCESTDTFVKKSNFIFMRLLADIVVFEKKRSRKDKKRFVICLFFHNLSAFDGVFIMNALLNAEQQNYLKSQVSKHWNVPITDLNIAIDPFIKQSKIYSISIAIKNKERTLVSIKFIDSFLILPHSLNNLSKAFLNKEKHGFDHASVSLKKLQKKAFLSECVSYLRQDLLLTYGVFTKAREVFYQKFFTDITTKLTLPSVAYSVFKEVYLKTNKKHQDLLIAPSGNVQGFIRQSYCGGRVDVFKPRFIQQNEGSPMYCYDVNSLYPFAMTQLMPAGKPTMHKGPINLDTCGQLGFVEAIVKVPPGTFIPILPLKVSLERGSTHLIFPRGTFKSVWYSEELKFALSLGYEVEVISALLYPDAEPFLRNYVEEIYAMRVEAKKSRDEVGNLLYKLLLNSLYGRFGMRQSKVESILCPSDTLYCVLSTFRFSDFYVINDQYTIANISADDPIQQLQGVSIKDENQPYINALMKKLVVRSYENKNQIHLASAITALARIHLNKSLLKYQNNVYYCDTDSMYLDLPMEASTVSDNAMGSWKLEAKIQEAYFINPKTYGYITTSGETIMKSKGQIKQFLKYSDLQDYHKKAYEHYTSEYSSPNLVPIEQTFVKNLKDFTLTKKTFAISSALNLNRKRVPVFHEPYEWESTSPVNIAYKDNQNLIIPPEY